MRAAVADACGVELDLKWPNDLLVRSDGRKLAGILCEFVAGPDPTTGDIIVGTGLNVHHTAEELPVPTATSLALAIGGKPPSREELIGRYLANLPRGIRNCVREERPRRNCGRTIGRPAPPSAREDPHSPGRNNPPRPRRRGRTMRADCW
jgi:biotin-(acetyl-CoA carboxylase) ligase